MRRVEAIPGFGSGWAWTAGAGRTMGVWWQTYSSGNYLKGAPRRAVLRFYLWRGKVEIDVPWGVVR